MIWCFLPPPASLEQAQALLEQNKWVLKFILMSARWIAKSPTFSIPHPLHFHPFLHLFITQFIHLICLVRTSLLRNSLEQKHHLLIHAKNDCKFFTSMFTRQPMKERYRLHFVLSKFSYVIWKYRGPIVFHSSYRVPCGRADNDIEITPIHILLV